MSAISPARMAAFQILMAVERGRAHSGDLLRGRHVTALSPADRNLATALVLGVLRWQIQLDHEIKRFLTKPGARIDSEVLIALRIGAFQLRHFDRIPARAAIDESVELAKLAGHRFASKMVNAVLRKLGTNAPEEASPETPAELSLFKAHPQWLVERWANNFGFSQACAVCNYDQAPPKTTLRIGAAVAEEELAAAGIQLERAELLTSARTVAAGEVTSTESFREGKVRIQDEGSQLIAELAAFAGSADPTGGTRKVLDACAAPGGKTLILLERDSDARVVACEASEPRLVQLKKRLAEFSDRVEFRFGDATKLQFDGTLDVVLADVPCSGTGTLARNPEIRHRLRAGDLPRHTERQHAILKAALSAVRPGGHVVYSTCSLEPEENEQVVARVLSEMMNVRQCQLAPTLEKMTTVGILNTDAAAKLGECLTQEGALRLLPGRFGTDGFFIALLQSDDRVRQ